MDTIPAPFVPPAPVPRQGRIGTLQMLRIIHRNPLELWGEPSYNQPWVDLDWMKNHTVIANDPGLIRHVLVENAGNYRMARVRQKILRPILKDGLLTAEGEVWKRSRKAMAPVFTPRNIAGFAEPMRCCAEKFSQTYNSAIGPVDIARDMTLLAYNILSQTLFSGEIAGDAGEFSHQVDRLFDTMGRVDPLDVLSAPDWLPRLTRIRGYRALKYFRRIVSRTVDLRIKKMATHADMVPKDFLTLLLDARGPGGLGRQEIEDNIITFIGAGHETTARALGWTIYLLAAAPWEREKVEREIDTIVAAKGDPVSWLDSMPVTRAVFEEAMRLYPPAPSINREAIADDAYGSLKIPARTTVLVMPWTLHRHRLLWDRPDTFLPSRFLPENRDAINRFQYLPFGAGPRTCIGASFAMHEAMIALVCLLSQHRFELADNCRPWPVQKLTTQPLGGLPMVVSRR